MSSKVKLIEDWRERWEPVTKDGLPVLAVADLGEGRIEAWVTKGNGMMTVYDLALIPKPRPKTYRPWRREEVPVDEWFRNNSSNNIFRIEGICSNGDVFIAGGWCSLNDLSTRWRIHRTTESGEWLPVEQCPRCGVEE